MARMPEKAKATLREQITGELKAVLAQRPDLRVVTIADGVQDNWAFLSELKAEGSTFPRSAYNEVRIVDRSV